MPRPTGAAPGARALLLLSPLLLAPSAVCSGLTLEEAVDRAMATNERALAAGKRAEAAESRVRRARAFFFPSISASGTYTRRGYETVREVSGESVVLSRRDALSATATATQVILDMRAIPIWRQTKSDRDAAALEAVDQRRLVGFDAASAFLTSLGLSEAAQAAERRLELANGSLKDARARFDAQIVGSNDVTRAELEVASAERERIRARNAVAEALLNLGFLLGLDVEPPLSSPEALLSPAGEEPASAEALVAEARRRRPDVAARKKRVEALRYFAQEPMNRYFPTLNAKGELKYTNESGFSGRDSTWLFSLDLGWSLFDGLARQADRAERTAQADAAALEERQREREVELDVKSALVSLENARAGIGQATVAAEVARKNAGETAELYRQGLTTALTVADANVRLFEAEVALVRERVGLGLARLDLFAATGLDALGKENP